jgi:hypothetical protein
MNLKHHQSNLAFRLMSLEFHLRDWFRPPIKILQAEGVQSGMTVLDFGCGQGSFPIGGLFPFAGSNRWTFQFAKTGTSGEV